MLVYGVRICTIHWLLVLADTRLESCHRPVLFRITMLHALCTFLLSCACATNPSNPIKMNHYRPLNNTFVICRSILLFDNGNTRTIRLTKRWLKLWVNTITLLSFLFPPRLCAHCMIPSARKETRRKLVDNRVGYRPQVYIHAHIHFRCKYSIRY